MAWGTTNFQNNMPEWATSKGTGGDPTYAANTLQTHGNTVFGVPVSQVSSKKVTAPGWVHSVKGTGPVVSFNVTAAGSSYVNGNIVTVSGGITNATGTVVTNGSGNVVSVTVSSGGKFINSTGTTVAVANSTGGATGVGSGATITFTLGGRAGRVNNETLVVLKSMSANGAGGEFTAL